MESGAPAALEAFWQEMAARSTPLIEPISGDESHMLVTFVWRGGDDLHNVIVVDGIAGDDFFANQLTRLPGSDVWFKSFRARADTHTIYTFSPNDPLLEEGDEGWAEHYSAAFQPDPLNPQRLWEDSVLRLPDAPPELWIEPRPGVPAGSIEQRRFYSEILKNERDIWIYTPPGYERKARSYPWMMLFDGWAYAHLPAPVMLDNLIAEGCIPPLAAIFVGNADGARTRELDLNPAFNDFLIRELLPWLHTSVSLSTDAAQTVIGGASAGGLAAAFAALYHPQVFGNVLAQGGAFWMMPGWDDRRIVPEDSEHGWLIRQYVKSEKLPLRFHLDVGIYEIFKPKRSLPAPGLACNRHIRDVLEAKGYPVHYVEFSSGHDFIGWREALPEAVVALMGKTAQERAL